MLAFLGDIHGFEAVLQQAAGRAYQHGCSALIQVGDMGIYPKNLPRFEKLKLPLPVYFVDGNHEWHAMLDLNGCEPQEIVPNLFYMPRGYVAEIGGKRIGFLGGAASIDKSDQLKRGKPWSDLEQVSAEDRDRLIQNVGTEPLDILVTHTPPQYIVKTYFEQNPMDKVFNFHVPIDWSDPSATYVQEAMIACNYPTLCISGHFHRSLAVGPVRILNINEYFEYGTMHLYGS